MDNQDVNLTAYCGLFCGDCIRYKSKVADLALELFKELKEIHFDQYVEVKRADVKEFEYYDEMIGILKAINKLKCSIPCRLGGNGCGQPCEIKKCVFSKAIEGCWECDEFNRCIKFEFLKPFHCDTPQQNLIKIKKYGLDKWSIYRGNCNRWLGNKRLI